MVVKVCTLEESERGTKAAAWWCSTLKAVVLVSIAMMIE